VRFTERFTDFFLVRGWYVLDMEIADIE